jgi:putative ABC transport system ATP-binding protein
VQKIELKNIIPEPLKEILASRKESESISEIWGQDVTFEKGKNYQVYAPSGKGKSTFIHILYGIRTDFSGSVNLEGQDTKSIPSKQWAEIRQKQVSVVFQDLRLFSDLTAQENLQVKLALQEDDQSEKAHQMAEKLGISPLLNKKTELLSYGERQRIAIIRALLQPFDFLLLDEPFSHLDEVNIQKAIHLILEACETRKAGFIMTSLGYNYGIEWQQKLLL